MNRSLKWCFSMLAVLVWTTCACAADPAANPAPQPPSSPAAPQNAPSIQIPETTYDFGEILEGGEVEHDFVVKNTGTAALEITQVRPG